MQSQRKGIQSDEVDDSGEAKGGLKVQREDFIAYDYKCESEGCSMVLLGVLQYRYCNTRFQWHSTLLRCNTAHLFAVSLSNPSRGNFIITFSSQGTARKVFFGVDTSGVQLEILFSIPYSTPNMDGALEDAASTTIDEDDPNIGAEG